MFERIKRFFKGGNKNVQSTHSTVTKNLLEEALGISFAISDTMQQNITLWERGYQNKWPWINEEIKGRNTAAAVSSEMARLVMTDFTMGFQGNTTASKTMEAFYQEHLNPNLRTWLEYAIALGGGVFKPYLDKENHIALNFIKAGEFFPTHFAPSGNIEGAVFITKNIQGKFTYYLTEHQYMTDDGLIIEHQAFKVTEGIALVQTKLEPVPLSSVPEWAKLQPKLLMTGISHPLFSYFRTPLANNIDLESPLGASIFARAAPMIEDLDQLYGNYNWEFESGKRAIYTNENAFLKDAQTGEPILPNKRLYKTLKAFGDQSSNRLFEDFSPSFRETELSNAMNSILMAIEDSCGLARGSFSLLSYATAKTATELKISLQRSYQTVGNIQDELKNTLERLYDCVNLLAKYYGIYSDGIYTPIFNFGDSVMDDRSKEFNERLQMISIGAMAKWELIAWYFGIDEETAKAKVNESNLGTPLFQGEE